MNEETTIKEMLMIKGLLLTLEKNGIYGFVDTYQEHRDVRPNISHQEEDITIFLPNEEHEYFLIEDIENNNQLIDITLEQVIKYFV